MEEFEGLTVSARPSIIRIGSIRALELPRHSSCRCHMWMPHTYYSSKKTRNGKRISAEGNIQTGGKGDYIMKRTLFRFFIAAVMIAGILPMTGLAQGDRCRRYDNVNQREY